MVRVYLSTLSMQWQTRHFSRFQSGRLQHLLPSLMCKTRLLPCFQNAFVLIAPTLHMLSLSKNCLPNLNFLCPICQSHSYRIDLSRQNIQTMQELSKIVPKSLRPMPNICWSIISLQTAVGLVLLIYCSPIYHLTLYLFCFAYFKKIWTGLPYK